MYSLMCVYTYMLKISKNFLEENGHDQEYFGYIKAKLSKLKEKYVSYV